MNSEYVKISLHNHIGGKCSDRTYNDFKNNANYSVDYSDAVAVIENRINEGIEIIALTNHNTIDVNLYIFLNLVKIKKRSEIKIIPGAELSLENNGKLLHVCILLEPNIEKINKIAIKLNEFIDKNRNNCITIEQLSEILTLEKLKMRAILIPHGIKQKQKSLAKNPEMVNEFFNMNNSFPILIEDNKLYHKATLLNELKNRLSEKYYFWCEKARYVTAHDRKEQLDDPTFFWGKKAFNSLYYAGMIGKERFVRETDIIDRDDYISRIDIKYLDNKSILQISSGLNTIIGESGSGKTMLLNWIYNKISGNNLENTSSSYSEYENLYENGELTFYDKNNVLIKLEDLKEKFNVYQAEDLYAKLIKIFSSNTTNLFNELGFEVNNDVFAEKIQKVNENIKKYSKLKLKELKLEKKMTEDISTYIYKSRLINENIIDQNLELLNIESITKKIEEYKMEQHQYKVDADIVKNSFKAIFSIIEKYFKNKKIDFLKSIESSILNRLRKEHYKKDIEIQKKYKEKIKKEKYNEIISNRNKMIGRNIQNQMEMKQSVNMLKTSIINNAIELKKIKKQETTISNLFSIKEIECLNLVNSDARIQYNNVRYEYGVDKIERILVNDIIKKKSESLKLNQALLKEVASEYNDIIDISKNEVVKKIIDKYVQFRFENDAAHEDIIAFKADESQYMSLSIELKISDADDYKDIRNLSAGELSKYYISDVLDKEIKKLQDKQLILFFDQPDTSLGKNFIYTSLVKKFIELKLNYQIFITTHEPMLVLNTDSNSIIRAQNDKIVGEENKFNFKNIDLEDSTKNYLEAIEELAEIIDGSSEAVKDRNNIYKGVKIWK
ncbi:MAG: hypothetical protein ACRCUP_01325 [Mycoplasmatales bacterium]